MGKKNWIEFDNQEKKSEETAKVDTVNKKLKNLKKELIKYPINRLDNKNSN